MSTYYVNINSTATIGGDGSESTPFTYNQLVNFFNPEREISGELAGVSATDGDIVKVRGVKSKNYSSSLETGVDMFVSFHESLSGTIRIEGWDVESNGSPILYNDDIQFTIFNRANDYLTSAIDSTLNVTLKNFIIDNYSTGSTYAVHPFDYEYASPSRKINVDFKTVAIKTNIFSQLYLADTAAGTSGYSNFNFYGCTLDCEQINSFTRVDEFGMYDSVLIHDTVILDLQTNTTLKASNNITTVQNYTSYVGAPGDVTQYTEPVYNSSLLGYSVEANSNDQITYYQTKTSLEYENFNIPVGGATDTFRTTNDYATGLFGETRTTYGAYVFEISQSQFLTGHIGAFYFGGDFENVVVTVDPGVIDLTPVTCAGVNTSGTGAAVINLIVPEVRAFGFDSFPFDFSGTPVEGASPLYVRYHVYNYEPRGKYAGLWEAYEFRWWFDYETSGGANDYIAVTTDRTEWLYCGFYGQTYDVRCCVMYRPIE